MFTLYPGRRLACLAFRQEAELCQPYEASNEQERAVSYYPSFAAACPDAYREGGNGYLFSTNIFVKSRYKRLPIVIKPQVLKRSVFHKAKTIIPSWDRRSSSSPVDFTRALRLQSALPMKTKTDADCTWQMPICCYLYRRCMQCLYSSTVVLSIICRCINPLHH